MQKNSLIIDAGYFIALLNKSDKHHKQAIALRSEIEGRAWNTTWPVFTEVCHLLSNRASPSVTTAFVKACQARIEIFKLDKNHLPRISTYMKKYEDLPMDLADASLVILAEEIDHGDIVSTDKRDFESYRWKSRKPFNNLLKL